MSQIVPIRNLGRRMAEQGRIRLGKKSGRSMTSLSTFRFTSPDRAAIEAIAGHYGGTAKAWSDPKASPKDQFEVETTASEIRVWLPPDSLSVWYEQWTGGGCARRCDGVDCQVAQPTSDGAEPTTVSCLCERAGKMECRPYTRLTVILPEIRFGGSWRMESKGWNAAHELPGMVELIEQLQAQGIVDATLRLEQRSKMANGQKKNFVVPILALPHTPEALLSGAASVTALPSAPSVAALAAGPDLWTEGDDDDDVVDAEIVDAAGLLEIEEVLALPNTPRWSPAELAEHFGEDLDRKVTALIVGTAKWSATEEGKVVKA